MIDLKKMFLKVEEFDGDVYVAHYTNQTNSAVKVKIAGVPFNDIAYFHLHNDNNVPLWAVNFEDNPSYIPEGVGNCECMVRVRNVEKGWWLLCELKYCLEKNIENNADSAYQQLKDTWQLLVDRKVINKRRSKTYLNISVPDHSNRAPFVSFTSNQNDQIQWRKKNKIHLLGHNDVLVVNEGILNVLPAMV